MAQAKALKTSNFCGILGGFPAFFEGKEKEKCKCLMRVFPGERCEGS